MSKSFKNFLTESIHDAGIYKAVFIVGVPGAGKTYTAKQLGGAVSPRIVNTDRAAEFLSKKIGKTVNSQNWVKDFKDSAHRITLNALMNYLNGMLPLFVDGTSSDVSNILHRAGILESVGYDVGIIFVDTPVDVAIKRAKERASSTNREVDEEFIRHVHEIADENKAYLAGKFSFFREIKNGEDELTDEVLLTAYRKVAEFFNEPVRNPVGRRHLDQLDKAKKAYMVPAICSREVLSNKVKGWYRT